MANSRSYPPDDVTHIITGCAEVIFEIESASDSSVRIDSTSTSLRRSPKSAEADHAKRICIGAGARRNPRGLRAWLKRAVGRLN